MASTMMETCSPHRESSSYSYTTPANLKPTLSASRFADFLSPPAVVAPREGDSAVLRMDRELRQQRESQSIEHTVNTLEMGGDMFVPDQELEEGIYVSTTQPARPLPLRPYLALPVVSVSCPVCAKSSMETPKSGQSLYCNYCDPSTTPLVTAATAFMPPTPTVAPEEEETCFRRYNSNSPCERFVLAGPDGNTPVMGAPMDGQRRTVQLCPKMKSRDPSPLQSSCSGDENADFYIDLNHAPNRRSNVGGAAKSSINLRPRRSRSQSPIMQSDASSDGSMVMDETDFFIEIMPPTQQGHHQLPSFASPPALRSSTTAAAPLLPMMTPENVRTTTTMAPNDNGVELPFFHTPL